MRKKSGLTIVEQAIVLVPEFENVVRKLAYMGKSCPNASKNDHKQVAKHHLTSAVKP